MRKAEFVTSSEKPAAKYLEWASEQGKFKYYDKAKGENILIDMPRFLVLMQFHTVKGWHDSSQSSIYSNEVKLISSQEMEVKAFKGGLIAKGIYKEIKERITAAGGHYVKSVYVMTVDGEVWNLQLKGAVVQEWGEVFNKCQSRFADEWVTLDKVDKRKKGRKPTQTNYFDVREELAVVNFLQAESPEEKNKIYNEFLRKPLDKMISSTILIALFFLSSSICSFSESLLLVKQFLHLPRFFS